MPRILRPQRRTAVLIVKMHDMLQHLHEGITFARLKRRQYQPLRGLNRRLDIADQSVARRRDVKRFRASIDRAAEASDEFLLFQARHHIADGGAIESDDVAKRGLINSRVIVDSENSGILNRRNFEFPSLIHEDGKRNLLKPTNEMARFLMDAKVVVWHQNLVLAASCSR
jgi:hypothetical protein